MGPLLGAPADMQDALIGKLDELKSVVDEVNTQFRNPDLTTFVCVCIPEFLSLYETERLVQELAKFEIDCRNVVVNQVISPSEVGSSRLLAARVRMQAGYLAQFDELYEDFHLVRMPLLDEEVRGVEALRAFSRFLVDPKAAEEAGKRGTLLPEGGDGDGKASASSSSASNPLEAEVERLRKRVAELEKELAGGELTADGTRRRTAGGVFFSLLKAVASKAQMKEIFRDREKAHTKKVNERRRIAGGRDRMRF